MGKKRTSDAKKKSVSSVFHHFKQAHAHGHENTSLRTYSETHAHMPQQMPRLWCIVFVR